MALKNDILSFRAHRSSLWTYVLNLSVSVPLALEVTCPMALETEVTKRGEQNASTATHQTPLYINMIINMILSNFD